jgi:hypothetical protein
MPPHSPPGDVGETVWVSYDLPLVPHAETTNADYMAVAQDTTRELRTTSHTPKPGELDAPLQVCTSQRSTRCVGGPTVRTCPTTTLRSRMSVPGAHDWSIAGV